MNPASETLQAIARLDQAGEPFVCVTLAGAVGSVPQETGAKMVVTSSGRVCGTVGGGRVEEAAIRHSTDLLASKGSTGMVEWNLQKDIGMTCGGVVRFLFEVFQSSSWSIAIFGAGHVSHALIRILADLNCRIFVFDTRQDLLSSLPLGVNIHPRLVTPLEDAVADIPDEAFVAVMTQGHRTDKPILERILRTRTFPYLGVIGSAAKAGVLRRELREDGLSDELTRTFRCPLGLPLGKDTPQEIAISIAAEMLQVRGS